CRRVETARWIDVEVEPVARRRRVGALAGKAGRVSNDNVAYQAVGNRPSRVQDRLLQGPAGVGRSAERARRKRCGAERAWDAAQQQGNQDYETAGPQDHSSSLHFFPLFISWS